MRFWLPLVLWAAALSSVQAQDIVVVGGTPGGIAAAVSAAHLGRRVTLVEYHPHIGGMTTSGLGKSDIENRAMIGGLFKEFVAAVHRYYVQTYGPAHENTRLSHDGYYAEPSVAEKVFDAMLAQHSTITVMKGWRLKSATADRNTLTTITVLNRKTGAEEQLRARVFIDATYEGDLYAAAGAEFRLGRESRAEFGEPHAGVVYFDYQARAFLPGTTGAADDRLPAYTYRLCLTRDPANAHRLAAPPRGYDRTNYLGYFDDLRAGRLAGPQVVKPGRGYNPAHFNTLVRALSVTDLPNRKTDVNINPRPLGFPFPEENRGYIEGDDADRQRISQRHRDLTLGLLWFLQNDPGVPDAHRRLANELHLPKDEFTDNGHFPRQLYVREGRRLVGEYTLTEHDITGKGRAVMRHHDSIAVGEFPIDSFPVRKRQPGDTVVLEGYLGMLDHITRPYEIPYRIMIPKRVDGLIVPVAASTTHVAFSSIRMEPTWMALGQAAGTAAHLAIQHGVAPRKVPMGELRSALTKHGQVLRHVARAQSALPEPQGVTTVDITSSFDGSSQKSRWWAPEPARLVAGTSTDRTPVPLLVALHTWSGDYRQNDGLRYLTRAQQRGWAFVHPDFRGPNRSPSACASDAAVADVVDAVAYAKQHAAIDENRIYLVGVSGGGHMALMMAARHPRLWAGVSAWVPITDLAAWYREVTLLEVQHAHDLEKVFGAGPGTSPEIDAAYRQRSPLFALAQAAGVPIDLNAGIHDGHTREGRTGSVPVSHTLRAFNALARANAQSRAAIPDEEIDTIVRTAQVPTSLRMTIADPDYAKPVLLRRTAGAARVTLFDGSHEILHDAALAWLSRQRRRQFSE